MKCFKHHIKYWAQMTKTFQLKPITNQQADIRLEVIWSPFCGSKSQSRSDSFCWATGFTWLHNDQRCLGFWDAIYAMMHVKTNCFFCVTVFPALWAVLQPSRWLTATHFKLLFIWQVVQVNYWFVSKTDLLIVIIINNVFFW